MSVVQVDEIAMTRRAVENANGIREYTRVFRVRTDSRLDDALTVLAEPTLPVLFDTYGNDTSNPDAIDENPPGTGLADDSQDVLALCKLREAREADPDNPYLWIVECHYGSDCPDPAFGSEDPIERAAKYVWTTEELREPVEFDLDDFQVVNSAGQPFEPPPEKDIATRVLTVTRNEVAFDPSTLDAYSYALNADVFFGYDPGQARMDPIQTVEKFEGATRYWEVTYKIKFKKPPRTWSLRILDRGPCVRDADDELVAGQDQNGISLNGPVLLDGNGHQLDITSADPHYLDFRVYPSINFAPLNLTGP